MAIRVLTTPDRLSRQWLIEAGLRGLHCGCGASLKTGCLNTDLVGFVDANGNETPLGRVSLCDERYYYLRHDAVRPLPLDDESIDWVYAEHFVEHIAPEQAVGWLAEVRRVLSPGGLVRLSTPDLRKYVQGYCDPAGTFLELHRQRLRELTGLIQPVRKAWLINQIFYRWGHRWIYDFDELVFAAAEAGFPPTSVTEVRFQEGSDPQVAALDLPVRNDESLYVEIRKPVA